jgi:hypothetical protein
MVRLSESEKSFIAQRFRAGSCSECSRCAATRAGRQRPNGSATVIGTDWNDTG